MIVDVTPKIVFYLLKYTVVYNYVKYKVFILKTCLTTYELHITSG